MKGAEEEEATVNRRGTKEGEVKGCVWMRREEG